MYAIFNPSIPTSFTSVPFIRKWQEFGEPCTCISFIMYKQELLEVMLYWLQILYSSFLRTKGKFHCVIRTGFKKHGMMVT